MSAPAEIHDLGYRKYDGERKPPPTAIGNLAVHGLQRVFGLKRKFRHKIMPIISLLVAYVPALIFVGIAFLLPVDLIGDEIIPSYGEYYGFILFALLLFCSFVAPEMLCTDRRTGMLGLYLASPLNRDTYLLGKLAATTLAISTMTCGPLLFLLGAYTTEGSGPDGVFAFIELLARILFVGFLVALFLAAFCMAISAVTPRRGVASAVIVMTFLVLSIVSSVLIETADAPDELALIDPFGLSFDIARRGLGERGDDFAGVEMVASGYVWLTFFGVLAACLAFTRTWYQRLDIER